jgi:hypothetical protein
VDPEAHQWNPHLSLLQLEPEEEALEVAMGSEPVVELEPEVEPQHSPTASSAVESYNVTVEVEIAYPAQRKMTRCLG